MNQFPSAWALREGETELIHLLRRVADKGGKVPETVKCYGRNKKKQINMNAVSREWAVVPL